jgi:hypothetical protein
MKRTQICATVVVLLVCAVAAWAASENLQGTLRDDKGPVSGVQVLTLGTLKPAEAWTDDSGNVNLALDVGNMVNKPFVLWIRQCDDKPPILYVVLPGGELPKQPDCKSQKLAVLLWTGSGWVVKEKGEPGKFSFEVSGAIPAAPQAPVGEAPGPFGVSIYGGVGFWKAGLGDVCAEVPTGSTCSVSDKPLAWSGGVKINVGPVYGRFGGFKGNDATINVTETSEGTSFSGTESVNVTALDVGTGINLLSIHDRVIVAPEGGMLIFTLHFADTFSSSGGGTSGSSTFRDSEGGVSPYYGLQVRAKVTKRLGAGLRWNRVIFRSGSGSGSSNSSLGAHIFMGFVDLTFGKEGTIFHLWH